MMTGALAVLVLAAGAGTDAYGGTVLAEEFDAAPLWFKVAGPKGAPTVISLHGGPGYT